MNQATHQMPGTGTRGIQYFGSDVHRLSQDLRTPLNSISGFAELILLVEDGLSPTAAEYIRAILSESRALTGTVVALLDRAGERGAIAGPPALAA